MHRRLFAALILHFLLCVGFSAAGLSAAGFAPHGPEWTSQESSHGPASTGALSDADDHALLDDKDDFPDPLEPHPVASVGVIPPVDAAPPAVNRHLSAVISPPHKPPKASGLLA